MNLLLIDPANKLLPPSEHGPHAGLMHRPENISATDWTGMDQSGRWNSIYANVPGAGDFTSPLQKDVLLHCLADRLVFLSEVDQEIVRDRERRGRFDLKTTDPEAYQDALDALSVEDRDHYLSWEAIWESVLAPAETATEEDLPIQNEPVATGIAEQETTQPVVATKTRRRFPLRQMFSRLIWRSQVSAPLGSISLASGE